ncbi:hypothetical protein C8J55DRAFT_527999 [Lentinula edodes]|uniref:Uncharacterized protein n=1 Tax=Lentinula lateritia TaxID=40482 RepID=A0A9W9DE32_9AGAR|nr:hypothetical protein C8J55DRAFT_527999 [Lentinula edodes]
MSTQPQQQHTDTDTTAHGQGIRDSTSPSKASDGVESVRKPEPGSIALDQVNVVQVPDVNPEVPFKERVIGVAKKTRGTILNKPEVKEHGEQILQGSASVHDATGRSVS